MKVYMQGKGSGEHCSCLSRSFSARTQLHPVLFKARDSPTENSRKASVVTGRDQYVISIYALRSQQVTFGQLQKGTKSDFVL